MQDSGEPRTAVYTSIVVLCIVILLISLVARARFHESRTELDVIRQVAESTADPKVTVASDSFDLSDFNPALFANLQQVVRSFQAPIQDCADKWPNHPDSTLVRIETDGAGRLVSMAVQNAPDDAESCLMHVLSRGQFARKTSGVVQFNLDFNR